MRTVTVARGLGPSALCIKCFFVGRDPCDPDILVCAWRTFLFAAPSDAGAQECTPATKFRWRPHHLSLRDILSQGERNSYRGVGRPHPTPPAVRWGRLTTHRFILSLGEGALREGRMRGGDLQTREKNLLAGPRFGVARSLTQTRSLAGVTRKRRVRRRTRPTACLVESNPLHLARRLTKVGANRREVPAGINPP